MPTSILSGDEGALLFDPHQRMGFGPLFKNREEAARFLCFIAEVDASDLSWTGSFASGPQLLSLWVKDGRVARRPVFQFDEKFLHKAVSKRTARWSMSCSFVEHCFPIFLGRNDNEVADILKRNKVGAGVEIESESSCIYVYFRTKKEGLAFLARVNGWLRKNWYKAYP